MRSVRVHAILPAILGIATVLLWAASPAGAAVLHVENFGVDVPTCGSPASPCRSISQAIENASDNDRIIVGPGVYGDLNGNGVLESGTGEEFGGSCIGVAVCIDKPLTIESSVGAGATLINTNKVNLASGTVLTAAMRAVFGGHERGFTIAPFPKSLGIYVFGGYEGVKVTGNLVLAGSVLFVGTKSTLTANVAIGPVGDGGPVLGSIYYVQGDRNRVIENVAIGTGAEIGFYVFGKQNQIQGNSSSQSITGFDIHFNDRGSEITDNDATRNQIGFQATDIAPMGHPLVLRNNRASLNGDAGFVLVGVDTPALYAQFTLEGNLATGNGGGGFRTVNHSIVRMARNVSSSNVLGASFGPLDIVIAQQNTFAGNHIAGVYTKAGVYPGTTGTAFQLNYNNIFGNGFGGQGQGGANCGLINDSGGNVDAQRNFWGAPTGPGPDPADAICDISPSTTSSVPFAPTPFPVP